MAALFTVAQQECDY